MSDSKQPEEKQFSLKPIQKQMLNVLEQQYFSALSNFLSFLALEMWGYTVTPTTQFRIDGDQVFIHEAQPEPDKPAEGASVAGGADTKDAIQKG